MKRLDKSRIGFGNTSLHRRGAAFTGHAGHIDDILQADRHTVKTAKRPAALTKPVAFIGPCEGPFGIDMHPRLKRGISLDPLKTGLNNVS